MGGSTSKAQQTPITVMPVAESRSADDQPSTEKPSDIIVEPYSGPSSSKSSPRKSDKQAASRTPRTRTLKEPLIIHFDNEGTEVTLRFTKAPIGLQFQGDVIPPTVSSVRPRSQAEEMGVKAGWTVVRAEGLDVKDKEGKAAEELVREATRAKLIPLTIVFDANGEQKRMDFANRPLGIKFNANDGYQVTGVEEGSRSESLGVEVGWIVKEIAGMDVNDMTITAFLEMVREKSAELPAGAIMKAPVDIC